LAVETARAGGGDVDLIVGTSPQASARRSGLGHQYDLPDAALLREIVGNSSVGHGQASGDGQYEFTIADVSTNSRNFDEGAQRCGSPRP
jgi:hypothetical protein